MQWKMFDYRNFSIGGNEEFDGIRLEHMYVQQMLIDDYINRFVVLAQVHST